MKKRFLFFSAEALTPTGPIIMHIIYPIQEKFNNIYYDKYC